ncbi:MAG: GLPGLI family protein [Psychroflexus halocasei]
MLRNEIKITLIVILISHCAALAQCDFQIKYKASINEIVIEDSIRQTDQEKHFVFAQKMRVKINAMYKDKSFTLDVKNDASIFKPPTFMEVDNSTVLKLADLFLSFPKKVYINKTQNLCIEETDLGFEKVYYENKQDIKWQILKEEKQILGYTAQKAIAQVDVKFKEDETQEFEVWFTKEIPCGFGPSNIHGLPGLILEINSKNYNLKAHQVITPAKETPKPLSEDLVDKNYFIKMNDKVKEMKY